MLIVDRKKDIIVSGGENISSLEVEKVLVAHAAVYEAVVIPVPHEKWGEVPKALVVRKPGAHVTEPELVEFCRSRLAHYKCPAIRGLSRQLSQDRHGQDPEAGVAKAVWRGAASRRADALSVEASEGVEHVRVDRSLARAARGSA